MKKKYQKRGNPYKCGETWKFLFYITDENGNKRVRSKSGYSSKEEAIRAKLEIEMSVLHGTYIEGDVISTGHFFAEWIENVKKPALQYDSYMSYRNCVFNYIVPQIGDIRLCDLKSSHIYELYRYACEKSLHVGKLVKTVTYTALDYAYQQKKLPYNPAKSVQFSTYIRKPLPSAPLESDIKKLLEASRINSELHLAILLCACLGLRKSEMCALKYSDINPHEHKLYISRSLGKSQYDNNLSEGSKTKSEKCTKTFHGNRYIDIPDMVLKYLEISKAEYNVRKNSVDEFHDDGYIFCTRKGRPLSKSLFYKDFKRLTEETGLEHITWHKLRRFYASYQYNQENESLERISKQLGHKNSRMSCDYYIDTREDEQRAMLFMNKLLQEAAKP